MRAAPVALLALTLALSDCGGIPTGGSVHEGGLINEETLPEVTYRALGPQVGATPLEIMGGFIAAATNPQNDYDIARLFLDESIRSTWDPDFITQIRTGVGVPRQQSETQASYSLTSSAFVNDRGQYSESASASQELNFSFVQDADGEWRISDAPPGIVLSREAFDSIFDASPLYFFGPGNDYLVPDLRWFPRTTLLTTRVVSALLEGQSDWLTQGVTTTYFPQKTKLASSVTVDSGVAIVDLEAPILAAPEADREWMRQQLRATIGNVSDVVLTVNGVAINIPESGAALATINPQVESQLLVQRSDSFGFLTGGGSVSQVSGLSAEIVSLEATDATIAHDRKTVAVLTATGVHLVYAGNTESVLLDARAGLIAPAVDTEGFVWTVPQSDATAITAFDSEGNAYPIDGSQFAGRAISLSISRDGARLLILVSTDLGPKLYAAGIVRREGVPAQLGTPFPLPVSQASIAIDAAWVDDNTVALLAADETAANTTVTLFQLGGQSSIAGRVEDGISIVGGNGGSDGLRVLTREGDVYLRRGNGWADTSTSVSFIATQQ